MGLALSGTIYFVQDFMLPYSNQRQDEYRNVIKGRAPQTYRDPQRKWMAGSGDRIYHYNYFDPNADLFGGISIFEFIPNTFELYQWVFATRGSWEGSHWVLEDGGVRRMDLKGKVDYRRFDRFDVHQLDGPDYFKKEVRTAAQMTYPELKRYITDLKRSGFDVSTLMVDLFSKTVLSAGVVYHGHYRHSIFFYDRQERRVLWDWTLPRYRNLLLVCVRASTSSAESTGCRPSSPPGFPT